MPAGSQKLQRPNCPELERRRSTGGSAFSAAINQNGVARPKRESCRVVRDQSGFDHQGGAIESLQRIALGMDRIVIPLFGRASILDRVS
jgi:hypothetical protein